MRAVNKKLIRWCFWLLVLFILLLAASIVSFCVGAVKLDFSAIWQAITAEGDSPFHTILLDIRLPRIILAIAVGGGLSLVGVLLQGVFRNPLVEPYTLGISGGACLGVCFTIALRAHSFLGVFSLPLAGFAGAMLVLLFLYSLSLKQGVLSIKGVLLSGVMISYISSSLIMLVMALMRMADLHGIIFWTMGSLEGSNSLLIKLVLFLSLAGLFGSYLFCRDLNALCLGEEEARHLGIDIERTKRLLFLLASFLTGALVAVAGIIGFVGLVVPHLARMAVGRDHRILLISSYLGGAAFLLLCDTLARTIISPLELPVGVITGIGGGSLFIWALTKNRASYE